ncbi:MAG: hypothetical protein PHP25_00145 [Candidatus Moranbacteria bacterium]|nr:hypothetical protein [Candidatus Moranbacteria bacterium]
MKQIADLLGERKAFSNHVREADEKSVESIFFSALKKNLPNIARADITNFVLRDKKIYLRTTHPAIAGEIWRKRERLKNEINDFFGGEDIKEIKVK